MKLSEFDKKIKENVYSLHKIAPFNKEAAWKRIESNLEKRKLNFGLFYKAASVLIICTLTSIFILKQDQQNKEIALLKGKLNAVLINYQISEKEVSEKSNMISKLQNTIAQYKRESQKETIKYITVEKEIIKYVKKEDGQSDKLKIADSNKSIVNEQTPISDEEKTKPDINKSEQGNTEIFYFSNMNSFNNSDTRVEEKTLKVTFGNFEQKPVNPSNITLNKLKVKTIIN